MEKKALVKKKPHKRLLAGLNDIIKLTFRLDSNSSPDLETFLGIFKGVKGP